MLISGCSSHHDESRKPHLSRTGSPRPTDPATIARNAALDAYRGMWDDAAQVGTTSDYQSPLLTQHATGNALTQLVQGFYLNKHNGLISRGHPVIHPQVTAAEPAEAPTSIQLLDCLDDSSWLNYRADNDQLEDDQPGGPHKLTATVTRQTDGTWKVSDFTAQGLGTCA